MVETKELRSERANLASEMQKLAKTAVDEKRSLTAEEQEKFDKLDKAVTELRSRIDTIEKANAVEAECNKVSNTIGRESRAVEAVEQKPEQRQLEAWRSYLIDGADMPNYFKDELRALSIDGTSGYTAPDNVNASYIDLLRNFADIRKAPV